MRHHTQILIITLTLLLFLAISWLCFRDVPPNKDFYWRIHNTLLTDGASVALTDIQPGDWQRVCFLESDSPGSEWSHAMMAQHFNVPLDEANFTGPSARIDEFQTILIFFTPPVNIEVIPVPSEKVRLTSLQNAPYYYGFPSCTTRNAAYLVAQDYKNKKGKIRRSFSIVAEDPNKD